MKLEEMRIAVEEAKSVLYRVDVLTENMLRMIAGRLRGNKRISGYILSELKRELRDFNIHTKQWKS
jgi:hypothetical protein